MKKFFIQLFAIIFIVTLGAGAVVSNASTDEDCNVYIDLSTGRITTYSDEESSEIVPQLLANTDFCDEENIISQEEANSFISPLLNNQISPMSTTPITITGSNQANSPYSKICHFKLEDYNGKFSYATGFFVGPNAVATAAHVAQVLSSYKNVYICYSFLENNTAKYAYSKVNAIYYHSIPSSGVATIAQQDYGLAMIGTSAGNKCGYFKLHTTAEPNTSDLYTLAGFEGAASTSSLTTQSPLSISHGYLRSVNSLNLEFTDFFFTNGLSGAPIYKYINGQWECIGIGTGRADNSFYYAKKIDWDVYKQYNGYTNFHSLSMYRCSEATKVANVKSLQTYINNNLPMQYLGTKLDVDGGFGPLTKTATIKLIQYWLNTSYNAGLAIDGGFGNLTTAAFRTIKKGQSGMPVYILQGVLYGNYYDPNGFDGSFGVNGGTGCLNAVKYAQVDKNINPINGEATAALVKSLCS